VAFEIVFVPLCDRGGQVSQTFSNRGQERLAHQPSTVTLIEAAGAAQIFERLRCLLGKAEHCQIGQYEAHGLIRLGGSSLTPSGDGSSDVAGRTA
jgi:hypothetical protein